MGTDKRVAACRDTPQWPVATSTGSLLSPANPPSDPERVALWRAVRAALLAPGRAFEPGPGFEAGPLPPDELVEENPVPKGPPAVPLAARTAGCVVGVGPVGVGALVDGDTPTVTGKFVEETGTVVVRIQRVVVVMGCFLTLTVVVVVGLLLTVVVVGGLFLTVVVVVGCCFFAFFTVTVVVGFLSVVVVRASVVVVVVVWATGVVEAPPGIVVDVVDVVVVGVVVDVVDVVVTTPRSSGVAAPDAGTATSAMPRTPAKPRTPI